VVINLFNFFRHYKSPPFHIVIRIHLISLSYILVFFSHLILVLYGAKVNINVSTSGTHVVHHVLLTIILLLYYGTISYISSTSRTHAGEFNLGEGVVMNNPSLIISTYLFLKKLKTYLFHSSFLLTSVFTYDISELISPVLTMLRSSDTHFAIIHHHIIHHHIIHANFYLS